MENYQLQVFEYQAKEEKQMNNLTAIEIDGETWFVAKEVCDILGIGNSRQAVSTLDDDEKNTVTTNDGTSGNPNKTIISESGLYALVFKSRLPSAQAFRKWVTKEAIPSIRKKGYYGKIDRTQVPNFYIRYRDNLQKIPVNKYFSVIGELFIVLYAELEKVGYTIPDKAENGVGMYPDISVGKTFAKYLENIDSEYQGSFTYYSHSFSDNRKDQKARMYELEVLPVFRKYVIEKWIPIYAEKYFKKRDPVALDYLPKLIGTAE